MSRSSVAQRPNTAIAAAVPGGAIIAVLGAAAAFAPAATEGAWWFLAAAVGALLLCVAILALRSRVDGIARPALAVAGVGMRSSRWRTSTRSSTSAPRSCCSRSSWW